MAHPEFITNDNFDHTITTSLTTVVVHFWARWCIPCTIMEPTLAEIASEYDGRLQVGIVDVDQNPNITAQYGVRSSEIPVTIVFKNGEAVERLAGVMSKHELMGTLNQHLG